MHEYNSSFKILKYPYLLLKDSYYVLRFNTHEAWQDLLAGDKSSYWDYFYKIIKLTSLTE